MQNIVLKIVILLFILNVSLLGSAVSEVATTGAETVEVSLESFTTLGIFVMIGLSSLLGAFFLKDEFSSLLD
ncbi:MAG TPA: hypothetical protein EYG94_09195 [Campylobacterales bacterium]|nr:hypothetical protein [Campylobacterales bacterium]